jgi:hypothetical protein
LTLFKADVARGLHDPLWELVWPGRTRVPEKRQAGSSTPPLTTGFAM